MHWWVFHNNINNMHLENRFNFMPTLKVQSFDIAKKLIKKQKKTLNTVCIAMLKTPDSNSSYTFLGTQQINLSLHIKLEKEKAF